MEPSVNYNGTKRQKALFFTFACVDKTNIYVVKFVQLRIF